MFAALSAVVPAAQIVVVHADLGRVEWHGVQDHIRATIGQELHVVQAAKSFFDMIRARHAKRPDVPPWPSSATRQCTSDLKRDPIHKFIRQDMKRRGATLAVNCTGIRAEESPNRAKKARYTLNTRLSKAGREVWEFLPIHSLTTAEVFAIIQAAGQRPFWAYKRNRRLSCVFCIMGCDSDLAHGAEARPELYQELLDLEAETGFTMFNGRSLRDAVEAGRAAA